MLVPWPFVKMIKLSWRSSIKSSSILKNPNPLTFKVNMAMALTQVRAFYFVQKKPRVHTFSLTLSLLIPAIHSSGKVPTPTQLSSSSTLSGCFVPLIIWGLRGGRRKVELQWIGGWGECRFRFHPAFVECCVRLTCAWMTSLRSLQTINRWSWPKLLRGQLLRRTRWMANMVVCSS